MPNGSIAKEIRLAHGLTQKEFAKIFRIPQPFLSEIERGKKPAPELFLARLKREFHLPPELLHAESSPYSAGDLNFRTKSISVAIQEAARITFSWTERAIRQNLQAPKYENLEVEGLGDRESPLPLEVIEDIAQETRQALGIEKRGVVTNVTRAMERKGIAVTLLENSAVDLSAIDGISSPKPDGRPVITVTEQQAGDRVRFTRAHELGHIVLHQALRPNKEAVRETEAHMFAGAFLFPEADARKELVPTLTPAGFAQVKARYGVSISALIRRAYDLDIINSDRYRSLMIQISSRGWRTSEPVEIPVETLKLVPSVDHWIAPPPEIEAPAPEEDTGGDIINLFG